MALSKQAMGRIIMASARSKSPIDDEILREIAEENDRDPEALIKAHKEYLAMFEDEDDDGDAPMPMSF